MVLLVLALLFVVVPIAELYVIIQVSHVIGGWETIALLLVESVLGAWLMKRQGRGVLRRIQTQLEDRQLPTKELVDGGLIIFAGALMLTPGFLTDVLGFALLIPPSRAVVRAVVMRRFKHRLGTGFTFISSTGAMSGNFRARPGAYDTTARERVGSERLPPGEQRP